MFKRRTLLSLLLILLLLLQIFPVSAMADSSRVVVTLGANLSNAQKADMLRFFGVSESEVEIILITNQDERNQLASLIPIEKIGSKTFSCALVSPTASGGIQVKTANLNYVSSNMIASTLCTSGVVNCEVLAAAPFSVSGTGALTGVMMAYETASGEALLPERKQLANEELVTTNNIAETIGQDEATIVVNDIKIRIIRDGLNEQGAINMVVDEVVNTTELAMQDRALANGAPMPKKLSQNDRNSLYDFGYKISQMKYKYEDVQPTLERVTLNAVAAAKIIDPLVETFDPSSWDSNVSADSVLVNTDDGALGDDAGINSTFDRASEGTPTIAETISTSSITLTTYADVEGASIIDGSDMLAISGKNGYALATIDGTPLTDAIYTSPNCYSGWFAARLANQDGWTSGVLAPDGSVVIPFAYGDVKILNENWAIGVTLVPATADDYDYESWSDDNYYKIENVDIYWLPTAAYMASLTRDNFQDARAYGNYLNIMNRATGKAMTFDQNLNMLGEIDSVYDKDHIPDYASFSYNGQQGLKAPDGTEILPASFRSVNSDVHDGHFLVSTGDTEGLVNLDAQLVVPAEYENIRYSYYSPNENSYLNFGYACVEKDDKMGYYKPGVGETCPLVLDKSAMENYGVSAIYTDAAGEKSLVSADGMQISLAGYSNIYALYYGAGTLLRTVDSDYNYGLIDWHGEELLPSGKYTSISLSGSGKYLVVRSGYNVPSRVFEVQYTGFPAIDTSALPQAAVNSTIEVATVEVERLGNITLTPYSTVPVASMINGADLLCLRPDWDSGYALMNLDGDILTEASYNYPSFTRGWITTSLYNVEDSEGILGLDGTVAVPCKYPVAEVLNENWGLGYNLVPTQGEEYDFKDYSDDSLWLIDTVDVYWLPTASYLGTIDRAAFSDIEAHGETINIQDRTTGQVGCFDKNLNLLGGVKYIYDSYEPRYSSFTENGQKGLKAPDGTVVMPATFRYIEDNYIHDGHLVVSTGEKEGLINLDGQLVVPAEYDDIRYSYFAPTTRNNAYVNFGYVTVVNDEKLGYYSLNEGETCPPQYSKDMMNSFGASGIYTDNSGTNYLIAGDGMVTSLAAYSDVDYMNYSAGALYRTEDENYNYGLIDWHGNEILPCAYDSIQLFGSGEYLMVNGEAKGFTNIYRVDYTGTAAAAAPAMPEITAEPEVAEVPATQTEAPAQQTESSESAGSFLDSLRNMLSGDKTATEAPTAAPTAAPTEAPTAAPTEAPTAVPTAAPTEAPAAPESANMVKTLLDSALLLAQTDFANNSTSVKIILEQAMAAVGESNASLTAVLNSAVTLIGTGAADAATVTVLIQSAITMLG